MDIKIYIGGHQATTTHFLEALESNKSALAAENTAFIPPNDDMYPHIFVTAKNTRKTENLAQIQQDFLQHYNIPENTETLIFIDNRIVGSNHRTFEKELFYPKPSGFIKQIQAIFETSPIRLFIETRDIATYLPYCYYNRIFDGILSSLEEFLATVNMDDMRWSSFIDRAQGRGTAIPITTWHYEDYSHIWRDVMGAISGVAKYQDFTSSSGQMDLGVNLQAALLFYKYIQKYPVQSKDDFEALKKLFLEHNLNTSYEFKNPVWTPDHIQALTHSYEDDWYYIERMEDVEIIQPRNFFRL